MRERERERDSPGLKTPKEVRKLADRELDSDQRNFLFEHWLQAHENWKASKLLVTLRSKTGSKKKGLRRWLTKADLVLMYKDEDVVQSIVDAKENDKQLCATQVRKHPDCPHREDMKQYLCVVDTTEEDYTGEEVEHTFEMEQDSDSDSSSDHDDDDDEEAEEDEEQGSKPHKKAKRKLPKSAKKKKNKKAKRSPKKNKAKAKAKAKGKAKAKANSRSRYRSDIKFCLALYLLIICSYNSPCQAQAGAKGPTSEEQNQQSEKEVKTKAKKVGESPAVWYCNCPYQNSVLSGHGQSYGEAPGFKEVP